MRPATNQTITTVAEFRNSVFSPQFAYGHFFLLSWRCMRVLYVLFVFIGVGVMTFLHPPGWPARQTQKRNVTARRRKISRSSDSPVGHCVVSSKFVYN